MKTQTNAMKYYIHNFDGNLMGPDGYVPGTDSPEGVRERGHLAFEFDTKEKAKKAHEKILGWGHGGVISHADAIELPTGN